MEIGALGTLASTAGPWIFATIVITIAIWKSSQAVIRVHAQRAEDWKAAAQASEAAGKERDRQVAELMDGYRTVVAILRSIEKHAESSGSGRVA